MMDEWELYDLENDPNEMNNVYANSEYAGIVLNLKKELAAMRIRYKDSPELDQRFIDSYN